MVSLFRILYLKFTKQFLLATLVKRVKRSGTDCKGGGGKYETLYNTNLNNNEYRKVDKCFWMLRKILRRSNSNNVPWGCFKAEVGKCRCSADSSYIWSYMQTFEEALGNLRKNTENFKSVEAETWEGNMYISYTCDV